MNRERPGLERVRDLAAEGHIQVVLAYAPDRLSRKYAYQILLIEELARHGVETLFVRAPQGDSEARESKVMTLRATYRDAGSVTVVDFSGRITLGDGSALLRKMLRDLLEQQRTRIVLNLGDVDYIDSSGIGELVSGYTSVKNRGGELKLLNLTKKVHDLLQITKLYTVFEVHSDEHAAVRSFR